MFGRRSQVPEKKPPREAPEAPAEETPAAEEGESEAPETEGAPEAEKTEEGRPVSDRDPAAEEEEAPQRPPAAQRKPSPKKERAPEPAAQQAETPDAGGGGQMDDRLAEVKVNVFNDLIESVDLTELGKLDPAQVREEIGDIVAEIINMRGLVLSGTDHQQVNHDICNDVLGLGPLEPLLARDDIADIMVNGAEKVYIETSGKIQLTDIRFRDNAQLMNICQRIVSAVGRRVDESSPICDARLADGSRVNVIAPPLAIDGPALTIRKFKKDKLTLAHIVNFNSITPKGAAILEVIGNCRINVMVSGGTGSGKTTLLNALTGFIDKSERVITCEDSAELQLQQPHVVRLETRPPNLEGQGEIAMRDLVKNCLRMRPERIIVGEVRGPEAFDLLQAMNTGHDGSMGTIHANNPRECISRIENMIAMGGFNLPAKTVREQIAGAVQVIVQASRLRDGSRKITHITEVLGMEGEVVTLQDLMVFEIEGEDENGKLVGRHKSTGLRPKFYDKARYFGLEAKLVEALEDSPE